MRSIEIERLGTSGLKSPEVEELVPNPLVTPISAHSFDGLVFREFERSSWKQVEAARPWRQPYPTMLSDQSLVPKYDLVGQATEIHATYSVKEQNVLLFGPTNMAFPNGRWSCAAAGFSQQFLDAYARPSFKAVYPGSGPKINKVGDGFELVFPEGALDEIRVIDEPVFLATPLEPDNWGRWIAEVIPKIQYYVSANAGRRLLCRASRPWQSQLLNFLGVKSEDIICHEPGQSYICEDVETLSYSASDMTVSEREVGCFAALRERCSEYDSEFPRVSKLFVSRRGHSERYPRYRVLQNETELIEQLSAVGFTAVNPEERPFHEQVKLFSEADVVVGLGGAAMYNTLFCPSTTPIVTIEANEIYVRPHSRLFSSSKHRYGIVIGSEDRSDASPSHKRWSVDVPRSVQAILSMI
jgi:hypothetical protein